MTREQILKLGGQIEQALLNFDDQAEEKQSGASIDSLEKEIVGFLKWDATILSRIVEGSSQDTISYTKEEMYGYIQEDLEALKKLHDLRKAGWI